MANHQTFNGIRFYEKRSGYFKDRIGRNMHRCVWEASHGPIPEGVDIHHVDGDRVNNAIENLAPLARGEHVREHFKSEERRAQQAQVVKVAQAASFVCDVTKECAQCGASYVAQRVRKTRARFCSSKCREAWNYANGVGFRTATCEACGTGFSTNCRKTRTCSYACGWVLRRRRTE